MIRHESYSYSQFISRFCMQKTSPVICSDILPEHRYTSIVAACPRRMLCATVYNSLAVGFYKLQPPVANVLLNVIHKRLVKCYPLFNRITKSS